MNRRVRGVCRLYLHMPNYNEEFYNNLEPFNDVMIRLLLAYPHIKCLKTDIALNVGTNYMSASFSCWSKNKKILDVKQKKRKGQLKLLSQYSETFYFFVKDKKTEMLSFIGHLRNAIAHGNIQFENQYIIIRDYQKNKKTGFLLKTPSAFCRIKKNELLNFITNIVDRI